MRKRFLKLFSVGLSAAVGISSCMPLYAAEETEEALPYVIVLQFYYGDEVFHYDKSYYSEELSTGEYEVLVYEEGSPVHFSVESKKGVELIDAITDELVASSKNGVFDFTMPAADLVLNYTEKKEEEAETAAEELPETEEPPETETAAPESEKITETEAQTETNTEIQSESESKKEPKSETESVPGTEKIPEETLPETEAPGTETDTNSETDTESKSGKDEKPESETEPTPNTEKVPEETLPETEKREASTEPSGDANQDTGMETEKTIATEKTTEFAVPEGAYPFTENNSEKDATTDTDTEADTADSQKTAVQTENTAKSGTISKTESKSAKVKIILSKTSVTYNGKIQKPAVKAVYVDGKKINAKNFTISYRNNKKPGIATVLIRGKGTYKKCSGTTTFQIIPNKTTVTKAKSVSSGKMELKWKKLASVSGYQIQYSQNKNFTNAKRKNTEKSSCSITNLKAGKTFYIRVRGYKKGTTDVYGKWSKIVKIKVR